MPPVTNDWRESRVSPRPAPSNASVNRSTIDNVETRRPTRLATANHWTESRFRERPRPSNSLLNRFTMKDTAARRQTSREFNNRWTDSNFRERLNNNSFVNRSRSTSFWSERRAAVTNNWRGEAFSGRQYWAFRNYQRQWHDSGWWHNHCGDRIVFITVYSQPFPFYFDAGYWYPAWGYYPDSYYPYDGPIYGYGDLPPDQVVANVQTQLYNEGYYDGPIDGILGPDTRAAIADYQADHGLAVTAAIDEPTVEALGLA
jgi:Putative peptidoglycan binding domain